eukprot:2300487-Amphidinium_carterae.2
MDERLAPKNRSRRMTWPFSSFSSLRRGLGTSANNQQRPCCKEGRLRRTSHFHKSAASTITAPLNSFSTLVFKTLLNAHRTSTFFPDLCTLLLCLHLTELTKKSQSAHSATNSSVCKQVQLQ